MSIRKRPGRLLATAAVSLFVLALAACQTATPAPTPTVEVVPTATAAATAGPTAVPTLEPIVLEGATTTESGLQYLEVETGDGASPNPGDLISMQFIATLADGTELGNTYTDGQPYFTIWGRERLLPGWEEGIGLMKVHGKAKMVLPAELAFGVDGSGGIPPNSQIVLEVELLSAEPAPVPATVAEADLTSSETGLKYYDITQGDGIEATTNSRVYTDYTIWVKTDNGYEYVASSLGTQPFDFVLGRLDSVFPGWDEGTTGMKVGGKRLLVIPSELGLGEQSMGAIAPNSVLAMEIELVEVKEPRTPTKVDEADFITTDSGLKYYDLVPGTGEMPTAGQVVVVHYTGWLEDGTQFDTSVDTGQPFRFQLGLGNVIPGWDEGVATMKVGGKRQLIIPPDLAYADLGSGNVIPPNATLIFEVELLEIQ